MDKQKLKAALIKLEKHTIEDVSKEHDNYLHGNMLDQDDVVDLDDQSHHVESDEVTHQLDKQIDEHQHHLFTINNISFEDTDTVQPGAVVKVNGRSMVIAVAHPRFTYNGAEFIGVSTESPIYQALRGKKAGDTVTLNNKELTIESLV